MFHTTNKHLLSIFAACVLLASGLSAHANTATWTLQGDVSQVSYGSIKKDSIGEANYFRSINGTMTPEGAVSIIIDLSSVETNIGIRNQRMVKHVFGEKLMQAKLEAEVDPAIISSLATGATTKLMTEGTLHFLDKSIVMDVALFIAKLSDKKIMVTTDKMMMIKADDLGINEGLDTLMKLAKLPGITRVSPVTLRLIFESK